jgi:hypothetical protein
LHVALNASLRLNAEEPGGGLMQSVKTWKSRFVPLTSGLASAKTVILGCEEVAEQEVASDPRPRVAVPE